jgi:hypothetical protein
MPPATAWVPGAEDRVQQRQQRSMQTKCSLIRSWRVSKGSASQSKFVAFESPKEIRKAEVLTKPVKASHHASCGDSENGIEQASEHPKTTRSFLKRLARGGFETCALP